MESRLSVLVVDDHELIRKASVELLSHLTKKASIDCVSTLQDAEKILIEKEVYDLILLDLDLPDNEDLEGFIRLKSISPETPIAIVSANTEATVIKNALNNGADGFIPKTVSMDIMLYAIELILRGDVYIPSIYLQEKEPTTYEYRLSSDLKKEFNTNVLLTKKQKEVLNLIQTGMSNKELALQLNCSVSTIKTHVSAILSTLGVTTRSKLIALRRKSSITR